MVLDRRESQQRSASAEVDAADALAGQEILEQMPSSAKSAPANESSNKMACLVQAAHQNCIGRAAKSKLSAFESELLVAWSEE